LGWESESAHQRKETKEEMRGGCVGGSRCPVLGKVTLKGAGTKKKKKREAKLDRNRRGHIM